MKISFLSGLLKFSRFDHFVLLLGLFSSLCGKCFLFLWGKIFFAWYGIRGLYLSILENPRHPSGLGHLI